jgi:hypothetical protein
MLRLYFPEVIICATGASLIDRVVLVKLVMYVQFVHNLSFRHGIY